MTTWFTADTHFGHENIIKFCNRPFSNVEEMNQTIIKNFNSVIDPKDLLVILGDVCMGNIRESLALIPKINGHKVLVPGNHDRVWSGYQQSAPKKIEMLTLYNENGLSIWPESAFRISTDGSHSYLICHFPYEGDSQEIERYQQWRPSRSRHPNTWLIHGHVHNSWKVKDRQINVGVDVWDFLPVHEDTITEIIMKRE